MLLAFYHCKGLISIFDPEAIQLATHLRNIRTKKYIRPEVPNIGNVCS